MCIHALTCIDNILSQHECPCTSYKTRKRLLQVEGGPWICIDLLGDPKPAHKTHSQFFGLKMRLWHRVTSSDWDQIERHNIQPIPLFRWLFGWLLYCFYIVFILSWYVLMIKPHLVRYVSGLKNGWCHHQQRRQGLLACQIRQHEQHIALLTNWNNETNPGFLWICSWRMTTAKNLNVRELWQLWPIDMRLPLQVKFAPGLIFRTELPARFYV